MIKMTTEHVSTIETEKSAIRSKSQVSATAIESVKWIPQDELKNHEISVSYAENIKRYFETLGVDNDPTIRRDQFAQVTEEDFLDLIGVTAGLLRSGKATFQHFDGAKVSIGRELAPDQRDKEKLLRKIWKTAQEFLLRKDLSDERALLYAAMTVGRGILLVHPFIDGNGRTSRVISYAIANGVSEHTSDLENIIGGRSTWNPHPLNYNTRFTQDNSAPFERALSNDSFYHGINREHFVRDSDGRALTGMKGEEENTRFIRRFISAAGEDKNIASLVKKHSSSALIQGQETTTLDVDAFWHAVGKDINAPYYARIVSNVSRKIHTDNVEGFLKEMKSDILYSPHQVIITTAEPEPELKSGLKDDTRATKMQLHEKRKRRFAAYEKLNINGKLTLRDMHIADFLSQYIPHDKINRL